jgi:drug/metabolite transporter (DMT)-like permease
MTTMQTRALAALVILGWGFGAAFLFMKVIVDEISPSELVAGRMFLGALTVGLVLAVLRRAPRLSPSIVGRTALLALMDSVLPFTLVAWAETRIDSGVASVLISTMPLFTIVIVSSVLPDERLAPVRLLGIGLGFFGVIALTNGDVLDIRSGDAIGMLAVIGAAASYAAAAVYAKVLLRSEDALSLTGLKLGLGAVLALGMALTLHGVPNYGTLSVEAGSSLVALGVLSTGFTFMLYFWLVANAGSVYASLVTYVVPVAGLTLGWAVLGEEIGVNTALGAALIATGVAGVMYGPSLVSRLSRLGRGELLVGGQATAARPPETLIAKEEYA